MRFWKDSDRTVRIRWYRVERDVPWVPQTLFSSWEWDGDEVEDRSLRNTGTARQGEDVETFPAWNNGNAPAMPLRQVPCGTAAQWLGDLLVGRDFPLPVNDMGVPSCCAVPLPPGQPAAAMLAQGWRLMQTGGQPAVFTLEGMGAKLVYERPFLTRLRFGLFQNNLVPTAASKFADFVAASFPGYSPQSPRWGSPFPDPGGFLSIRSGAISWSRTAGAGVQTVYGWYLFDAKTSRVVWAQRFAAPVVIAAPGPVAALAPLTLSIGPLGVQAGAAVLAVRGGIGLGGAVVLAGSGGLGAAGGLGVGGAAALLPGGAAAASGGAGAGGLCSLVPGLLLVAGGGAGAGGVAGLVRGFRLVTAGGAGAGGACSLTGAAPSGLDMGFNFRDTSGYVTDPTDDAPVLGESYPHTYTSANGQSATGGWTVAGAGTRDRDNTVDARLAGINFDSNLLQSFRVDLPTTGNYEIRVALGDATSDNRVEFNLYDGGSLLHSFHGFNSSGNFTDAQDNVRTTAAWPGSNSPQTFAFSSTVLTLRVNSNLSGNAVAHLHVKKV